MRSVMESTGLLPLFRYSTPKMEVSSSYKSQSIRPTSRTMVSAMFTRHRRLAGVGWACCMLINGKGISVYGI
jgi:hypothetical protein